MELYTSQAVLTLPTYGLRRYHHRHRPQRYRLSTATHASDSNSSLSQNKSPVSRTVSGSLFHRDVYFVKCLPRATKSDETSTESNRFVKEDENGAIMVEDVPSQMNEYSENILNVESPTESLSDAQVQINEFLEKINVKVGSEDAYPILLYGSGALIAVWLASAIVSSVESIPLVPKLFEVVGLGYSIWFTSRYLLFKKNRDELAAKIEELKQQVLGLGED